MNCSLTKEQDRTMGKNMVAEKTSWGIGDTGSDQPPRTNSDKEMHPHPKAFRPCNSSGCRTAAVFS